MSAREPTTLYLVRHGESEANAAGVFAGHMDSPLTKKGRYQAELVAEALARIHFDRIVTSDLSRTRDTAEMIAAKHGLAVEVFPELREIDVGDRTGKPADEIQGMPQWRDDGFVQWPGGESLEQVLARTTAVIRRIVEDSPGQTVCIVGHGGVNRILVSHFRGTLPKLERGRATNTNVTVVVTDGTTHRIDKLFADAHVV